MVHIVDPGPRALCGRLMTGSREAPVSWWRDRYCRRCFSIAQRRAVDSIDLF